MRKKWLKLKRKESKLKTIRHKLIDINNYLLNKETS